MRGMRCLTNDGKLSLSGPSGSAGRCNNVDPLGLTKFSRPAYRQSLLDERRQIRGRRLAAFQDRVRQIRREPCERQQLGDIVPAMALVTSQRFHMSRPARAKLARPVSSKADGTNKGAIEFGPVGRRTAH